MVESRDAEHSAEEIAAAAAAASAASKADRQARLVAALEALDGSMSIASPTSHLYSEDGPSRAARPLPLGTQLHVKSALRSRTLAAVAPFTSPEREVQINGMGRALLVASPACDPGASARSGGAVTALGALRSGLQLVPCDTPRAVAARPGGLTALEAAVFSPSAELNALAVDRAARTAAGTLKLSPPARDLTLRDNVRTLFALTAHGGPAVRSTYAATFSPLAGDAHAG